MTVIKESLIFEWVSGGYYRNNIIVLPSPKPVLFTFNTF